MDQTKFVQPLEARLDSEKRILLENLRETKLVINPTIEGTTLIYTQRRGNLTREDCKAIRIGLKLLLERHFRDNVDINFKAVNEQNQVYCAELTIVAEEDKTSEYTYKAIEKINRFLEAYIENKRRKR